MRHVPSSDTVHAGILTFKDALIPNSTDYDRERWIYVPDHYSEYRYILGTRGSHPLICIGINPSTASPDHLDNTLKSTQRIALNNGFDSFIMFNVYAQRATLPDDMEKEMNPQLHLENMKAFEWILNQYRIPCTVWAAWGDAIDCRPYLGKSLVDIQEKLDGDFEWFRRGTMTRKGNPRHPLYMKEGELFTWFPVFDYATYYMDW